MRTFHYSTLLFSLLAFNTEAVPQSNALNFNGTSDYVDNSCIMDPAGSFTMEAMAMILAEGMNRT